MVKTPIYMDNNSTTRTDPRVVEPMLPYFTEKFGNAASRSHPFGWEAEAAVEEAREQIATLIGATAKEMIFTSGATESNNLAIKGVAAMYRKRGNHVVTQATEHKATLDTCKRLERDGFQVTYLPVDKFGQVHAEQVRAALTDKTILVSIMAANNEIGTLQPISEIGRVCKEKGVLFHSDAAQAAGKLPLDVEEMGIDLLSLSAHKLYGPKGIGALYVRRQSPHVRLYLGQSRAELRPAGLRRERRAGPQQHPVRPGPLHDRGRDRLCRGRRGPGGQAPSCDEPDARAGTGRRPSGRSKTGDDTPNRG